MDRGVLPALFVVKRLLACGVLASACSLNPQGEDPGLLGGAEVQNSSGPGALAPGAAGDGMPVNEQPDSFNPTQPPAAGPITGPDGTIVDVGSPGESSAPLGPETGPGGVATTGDDLVTGSGGAPAGETPAGGRSASGGAAGAGTAGAAGSAGAEGTEFDGGTFNYGAPEDADAGRMDAGRGDAGAPDGEGALP